MSQCKINHIQFADANTLKNDIQAFYKEALIGNRMKKNDTTVLSRVTLK